MNIVKAEISHIKEIFLTEQASFTDPWSENSLISVLDAGLGIFLAAEENGDILGYIIGSSDGYIEKTAVSEKHRRKGIGTALLSAFEKALPKDTESISLEVRVSNLPAINMYQSFGFEKAGIRKGFYSSPKEDAIVMIKNLQVIK